MRFDYQGVKCEYYLVQMKSKVSTNDPNWISVIAKNEHRRGKIRVAYVEYVRVIFNGGLRVGKVEVKLTKFGEAYESINVR